MYLGNVLIVDDCAADAEILRRQIGRLQLPVFATVVRSADAAKNVLLQRGQHRNATRPGLVLLDVNMPGLTGRDLHNFMRMHKDLADIPVVFLSGHPAPDLEDEVADSDHTLFFRKPDTQSQLSRIVMAAYDFVSEASGQSQPVPV